MSSAPPPIGLTELDLFVLRDAERFDWYAELDRLSDKAHGVLRPPAVVMVIANASKPWQSRGSTRVLNSANVEKDDYAHLSEILADSMFVWWYQKLSQSPRVNASTASMDFPTFCKRRSLDLAEINKLPLSEADKARFKETIGGMVLDHRDGSQLENLRNLGHIQVGQIEVDEIVSAMKSRQDRWNSFLSNPKEVPKARAVQIDQAVARLQRLTTDNTCMIYLEPIQAAPNRFKIELGGGDRLLLTMTLDSPITMKRDWEARKFAEVIESPEVCSIHLDTLGEGVLSVPDEDRGCFGANRQRIV